MIEICKYEECTGCSACANICGHAAIEMKPNQYGFIHPVISQTKCTDCGACKRVCPNNSIPIFREPVKALAGCAQDPIEQLTSTSGGIASVISRSFLRKDGIVYGCSGIDCKDVHHIRISDESDIDQIKGSKYVQSNIGLVFKSIRADLQNGKSVLFIGTPCQVAGLLSLIPQRLQSHLLTIDFVCHGVPSQRMLNEAIDSIERRGIPGIDSLQFRVKKLHFKHLGASQILANDNIDKRYLDNRYTTQYGLFGFKKGSIQFSRPFPKDNYIVGFLTGLLYRDSCYLCHYAHPQRVSDITVGDYHFDYQHNPIPGENRILSKIIINTTKGEDIINELRYDISCQEIDYKGLLKDNGQLMHPMKPHPMRSKFLEEFPNRGMSCLSQILNKDKKRIGRHIMKTRLRNTLYSIPFLRKLLLCIKK